MVNVGHCAGEFTIGKMTASEVRSDKDYKKFNLEALFGEKRACQMIFKAV